MPVASPARDSELLPRQHLERAERQGTPRSARILDTVVPRARLTAPSDGTKVAPGGSDAGNRAFPSGWWRGMTAGLVLAFTLDAAQADEIDEAFARMSELAAEERVAMDGLPELRERVQATRLGFETSQDDLDEDELGSDSDVIDVALADTFRDVDALGRELAKLNTERALLQSWYDGFVPIAANLGPRQFEGLSQELARLRAAGAIRPGGPAALADMRAVRDRLATLTAEARGLGERDAAERARLHARDRRAATHPRRLGAGAQRAAAALRRSGAARLAGGRRRTVRARNAAR